MIAAIDARKSTEQTGVSDEEKSVTCQINDAKTIYRPGPQGFRVPPLADSSDDAKGSTNYSTRGTRMCCGSGGLLSFEESETAAMFGCTSR